MGLLRYKNVPNITTQYFFSIKSPKMVIWNH